MKKRKVVRAKSALEQHESHLCTGRPREADLDADAGGHDQRGENRRDASNQDQKKLCELRLDHQRCHPDHQNAPEVDDAGMKKGGYRRGRLHHLNQPTVKRKLRAFEGRAHHEQNRGAVKWKRQGVVHREPPLDLVERKAPRCCSDQREREEQEHVGDPADDELFVSRDQSLRPVRIEGEELMQRKTRGDPRGGDEQQMVGANEHHHRAERRDEPTHVPTLARVSIEIRPREPKQHHGDDRNQAKQHEGDDIETKREQTVHSSIGSCGHVLVKVIK